MDFIRAVGKAVFADFPEQEVRKMLLSDYPNSRFEGILKEVLAHSATEFSRTEVSRIIDLAKSKWFDKSAEGYSSGIFNPESLFGILTSFGEESLDISKVFPRVKFGYLLRWHDLTYMIHEDTVVIPSLVMNDLKRLKCEADRRFDWPDILNHDNDVINRVLDKGLADTHAHLNASSDVFMLNWLAMMNSREAMKNMADKVNGERYLEQELTPMESDRVNPVNGITKSFYNLGLCAALCRMWLFVQSREDLSSDGDNFSRKIYNLLTDFINEDVTLFSRLSTQIYEYINLLRRDSLKTPEGRRLDYALTTRGADEVTSPYFILSGERRVLYRVFRRIFTGRGDKARLSKVLYLYLILKNRLRREFVQSNHLVGFENFQIYQSRKGEFFNDSFWWNLNLSYAVLSSLDHSGMGLVEANRLEGRVTSGALRDIHKGVIRNPFEERSVGHKLADLGSLPGFSIVVHYIKKQVLRGNRSRWYQLAKFRGQLWKEMNLILKYLKGRVTGIDVAGSELNCRPEIFAPMFRWAKSNGLGNNMTFHAGEDYYDLLDGLRTIYEAVYFMNFDSGCRIGHGLALGKDAGAYYADRHQYLIAPAQIVLDNLIWMKYYAVEEGVALSEMTRDFIHRTTHDLFELIGYKVSDSLDYWRSMLMRGNDVDLEFNSDKVVGFTIRSLTKEPDFIKNDSERCDHGVGMNDKVEALHRCYEMSDSIFEMGSKVFETKIPCTFAEDVAKLQRQMLRLLERKGITIEANPSSNVKIGGFRRYDELPLFRFYPVEGSRESATSVSVNTDDRGVFYTSIRNEYSLVAAALMKMKDKTTGKQRYSMNQVADYIECLVQNGRGSVFGPSR